VPETPCSLLVGVGCHLALNRPDDLVVMPSTLSAVESAFEAAKKATTNAIVSLRRAAKIIRCSQDQFIFEAGAPTDAHHSFIGSCSLGEQTEKHLYQYLFEYFLDLFSRRAGIGWSAPNLVW